MTGPATRAACGGSLQEKPSIVAEHVLSPGVHASFLRLAGRVMAGLVLDGRQQRFLHHQLVHQGVRIGYFTSHGAGEFDQLIIVPPRHRRQSDFLVAGLECGARFGQRELQAGRLQRPDIDRSFIAADDQLPPLVSLHFQ